MAAGVSCWMKNKSEIPITRDLLGQFSLDLSGSHSQRQILYKKRCKSLNSPENNNHSEQGEVSGKEEGLDIVGGCNRKGSSEEEETRVLPLELKLPLPNPTHYSQTVVCCTSLDTVKSALERAAQTNNIHTTNTKTKPPEEDEINGSGQLKRRSTCGMFATRCPSCFMCVITLKANPTCPNCNLTIPHLGIPKIKRPRIDLNQSLSPST